MLEAHFLRMVPSSALAGLVAPISVAQIGDGVFFFERQSDDRSAGHEVCKRTVEWTAGVHGVKLLSLMLGNFQHLDGENAEAVLLKLFDNVADCVFGDGVRFHDGKSALQSLHS